LLDVAHVIPCHYATFGLLTGTPEKFSEEIAKLELSTQVHTLEAGKTAG